MKYVIHDYAGHPFQVHLSRHLALRGHDVTHVYFADNPGPKGAFNQPNEPASLHFVGISLGQTVNQSALLARRRNDIEYGQKAAAIIRELNPDAVLSGNTPTEAQKAIIAACQATGTRFVYWVQDVYSIAVTKLLAKKLPIVGSLIGRYYQSLDKQQFRDSDAIVVITKDFVPMMSDWCRDPAKVSVIENWAAIDEIKVGPKSNPWSQAQKLDDRFTFLYSGTLGRKHNPSLLVKLADAFPQATMTAVAQGVGVKDLEKALWNGSHNLRLMPLQPAAFFPDVLATADVLVAMIEADAGTFAVPSKVQSYLCAGRPILLAAPKENLAARTVLEAEAGFVVEPGDLAGFMRAAEQLHAYAPLRAKMGANGRAYAEKTFDISRITDKFETALGIYP